jgi:hypothetical protein
MEAIIKVTAVVVVTGDKDNTQIRGRIWHASL